MKAVSDVKLNQIVQRFLQLIGNNTQAAHAVDITNKISLSWRTDTGGGVNLDWLAAVPVKYIYHPGLGVVFFQVELQYRGSIAEGERVNFMHAGGYAPKEGGPFGMTSHLYPGLFASRYETIGGETNLYLTAQKAIGPTEVGVSDSLTGWYFCDGV